MKEKRKIIKFPEPEKKVVQMPNVASYPDFITGVSDLKARMGKGEISQASHDKLYTDLIHRFMRKESFETPWFLREAPQDKVTANKLAWVKDKLAKGEVQDAETIDFVYKILNKETIKSTIDSLVKGISTADADISQFRKLNQGVFSKLIRKMPVKKEQLDQFLKKWNDSEGFVDTAKLTPGNKGNIKDLIPDPTAQKAFEIFESVRSQYRMPKKASTDLAKQGFTITGNKDALKVDGKGADLNKYATDLKNFYGATVKAESLEEARGDAPGLINNVHKNLQDPDPAIRKPTVKAVADAFASRGLQLQEN